MSSYDPIGAEKSDPFPPDAYQSPGAPVEQVKRGPGCLFWGCLISAILMIVVIILIIVGIFIARNMAINFLEQYTEPQPAELPKVALNDEERAAVVEEWEAFKEAVEKGEDAALRIEDSDRLNVIAQEILPEAEDRAYLTIEGDQLKGQCSLPVDVAGEALKTDRLSGRYFNFEGTFDVFIRNGSLFVTLQDGSIKGEPIPDEALAQFRNQNLAEDVGRNSEIAPLLQRLELEIEDGAMIIRSRGDGSADADADADADAEAEAEAPAEEKTDAEAADADTDEGSSEKTKTGTEPPDATEGDDQAAQEKGAAEKTPEPPAEDDGAEDPPSGAFLEPSPTGVLRLRAA